MTFSISWDLWRFWDGEQFPEGLDGWPGWLEEAIFEFGRSGKPYAWDTIRVEGRPPGPPYLVLDAIEPHLKAARWRVAMKPETTEHGDWSLLIVDVEKL